MKYNYQNGCLTISGLNPFSLDQCLCCGQAFRWKPQNGGFFGIALSRAVFARQHGDTLYLRGIHQTDAPAFLRYFDLERDYDSLQKTYSQDPFLHEGISYARGLRVLAQPPFETLITFIISANNNVRRITRIVDALCTCFGRPLECGYDFPTPQALASAGEDVLSDCGAGYRAGYIKRTASMVADGFCLETLADLPYEMARKTLTALPGVGLKVADCVALYGLSFMQSFPFDVWMRRVLHHIYKFDGQTDAQMRRFVDNKFGPFAGIAQQYLFHFARHHKDIFRSSE